MLGAHYSEDIMSALVNLMKVFVKDHEIYKLMELVVDAVATKEQDAVEPIKPLDKDDDFTFLCSNCKGELFCGDRLRDNFCSTCGRRVNWK